MIIWGRLENSEPEKIDTVAKADANYLVSEYRLAFGPKWKIWVGRKKDEPRERQWSKRCGVENIL